MNCPHCQDAEKTFGSGVADRELQHYRTRGPGKTTRLLIEALKASGIEGLTLLDIGGGVGVIQQELLKAGASSAIVIATIHAAKSTTARVTALPSAMTSGSPARGG